MPERDKICESVSVVVPIPFRPRMETRIEKKNQVKIHMQKVLSRVCDERASGSNMLIDRVGRVES